MESGFLKECKNIWINGKIRLARSLSLPVGDRAFMLGDGIFETLQVKGNRILEFDDHLSRLKESADILKIELPRDIGSTLKNAIAQVSESNVGEPSDARTVIRITISRGRSSGYYALPDENTKPNIVIQEWQVDPPSREQLERGLHLITSALRRDVSNPLIRAKTVSRADFVYSAIEARKKGGDQPLFLTNEGYITESASSNFFVVRGRTLKTPPLSCAILSGTTRKWIITEAAPELDLSVSEENMTLNDLFRMDEAFLASSVAGIVPVTKVDDVTIGNGTAGGLTMILRKERESWYEKMK